MVSEFENFVRNISIFSVLILVLVEDGLGDKRESNFYVRGRGLNPCFSGGWSRRIKDLNNGSRKHNVLILVLVEDGLGDAVLWRQNKKVVQS